MNTLTTDKDGTWIDSKVFIPETKNIHTRKQLTGLKDKNGKEIYEGDILQTAAFKKHEIFHIVQWDERRNGWSDYSPKDQFEVVGNIYENPELLEATK